MTNQKELLLDYLTEIITSEFKSLKSLSTNGLSQYGVGQQHAYEKLYEVIKKYNK